MSSAFAQNFVFSSWHAPFARAALGTKNAIIINATRLFMSFLHVISGTKHKQQSKDAVNSRQAALVRI
jgi:hypothetical protein